MDEKPKVLDRVAQGLRNAHDNGVFATVNNVLAAFPIGGTGKASQVLAAGDALIRSVTGNEHGVLSVAAQLLEKAGTRADRAVVKGVEIAQKGNVVDMAKGIGNQLQEHLKAGADAVRNGAKTAMAQVTGKGNSLA